MRCRPSTMHTPVPAEKAFTREMNLWISAEKVTISMITNGGTNVLSVLPVTFRNTQSVISTSALRSWFALPNSGQILEYPNWVRL